ncbi:hypothetical protein SKAU_G00118080 [Synaphobranchus kaupii]|uniref:Macrophage-expressed gene 1 protein n=1 Tax=Synaphobranchus kaupii TaxID=118154 RepID=A0A9Q1FN50_SYNKA|nr:hypothetical protein SKAU_G00118080 [Synaphobranchus kaupii]
MTMTVPREMSFTVIVSFLTLLLCISCTVSDNGLNLCRKSVNVAVLGVLPGGGWDNLRNLDTGRVMNMNYSLCQTTEDGAYLLPNEVFAIPEKSTKVEINSEIIKSWVEQSSSTALSINGDVKFIPQLHGKFSVENQRMKRHQVKKDSSTSRTEVRNLLYDVKVRPVFTLDPTFKSQVTDIASALENNDTRSASFLSETLVLDYGTHVLTSVLAGASLMKEDYISTSFVRKSEERSISVSASASFFKVVEFGLNFSSKNQLDNTYKDSTTHSLMLSQGGIPFYPGITLQKWQESLGNNLVAQDRSGLPLPFFLNKKTLPELPYPTVLKLANAVSQAILRYYTVNSHPGCTNPGSPNYNYQANIDDQSCDGLTENLNLGGVFQRCTPLTNDQDTQKLCQTLTQKNPMTGAMTCEPPYKQTRLRTEVKEQGQSRIECRRKCRTCWLFLECCKNECGEVYRVQRARVDTYWCATDNLTVPRTPGFLFGGFYGPELVNTLTTSKSCPSGFIPYTLMSDGLKICLSSSYEAAARFAVPFGGLISCEAGNPMAGGLSRCPAGFTQHSAGVSDGCELLFCVRSGSFSQGELPKIRLPPFTRRPLTSETGTETVAVVTERGGTWVRAAGTQQWTRASGEEAQRIAEDFTSSGAPGERWTSTMLLTILLSTLVAIL